MRAERSPARGIHGHCRHSRRGRLREQWGRCTDAVWDTDRQPRAKPPEIGGPRVTLPWRRRGRRTVRTVRTVRAADDSGSQALPWRGGASRLGDLPWLLPAAPRVLRPLLCGQEGIPRVGGRPRRVETGVSSRGGGGGAWQGRTGRRSGGVGGGAANCLPVRLQGRAGESVREDPLDSRLVRVRLVSEETSARARAHPRGAAIAQRLHRPPLRVGAGGRREPPGAAGLDPCHRNTSFCVGPCGDVLGRIHPFAERWAPGSKNGAPRVPVLSPPTCRRGPSP